MKRTRQSLSLDPRVWQHPADRGALAALQRAKGIDDIVQRVIGLTQERSLRLIHLASSVRVGERQFPRVHEAMREASAVFGVDAPEVFVSQSPFWNAAAIGADKPFVVMQSSFLSQIDDDELLAVMGHELGHILCGHVLYKTLLWLLLSFSFNLIRIPGANLILGPVLLALREWDRKSELSADRAGLLATQDEEPNHRLLMKLAGGSDLGQMNVNEFFLQAAEYEEDENGINHVHKLLNMMWNTHPFAVVRLKELKTWVDDGSYEAVLSGAAGPDTLDDADDFTGARDYYQEQFVRARRKVEETVGTIKDEAVEAAKQVGDALRGLLS